MRKYKSRHRIYTIVVGRKKPYIFAALIASVVMAFICVNFFANKDVDFNNSFLKLCVRNVMYKPDDKNRFFRLPDISADFIMRHSSPVFLKADNIVLLGKKKPDPKKTNKTSSVYAQETKKNINKKSITSNNLDIKNDTPYNVDAKALSLESRTYNATGNEPKVLIIHTHACETYSDKNGVGLGSAGTYRTQDNEKNMIKIGETIENVFKEKSISVIHDKTLCDYPSYNNSYVKSLGVIDWYLQRYPSIEFVFDIHRDAIAADDGTPTKLIATINGKECAQSMIVCGTDAMGLENPYWKDNLILAMKIQKTMESMYPGLMRPVNLREERFNMHKTKGSLIFEVGTHANTLDEALLSARYLADGISKTIKNGM